MIQELHKKPRKMSKNKVTFERLFPNRQYTQLAYPVTEEAVLENLYAPSLRLKDAKFYSDRSKKGWRSRKRQKAARRES